MTFELLSDCLLIWFIHGGTRVLCCLHINQTVNLAKLTKRPHPSILRGHPAFRSVALGLEP